MIYNGGIELKNIFYFGNELKKVYCDNKLIYEKESDNTVIGKKTDSGWGWFIPPFTQQNMNANPNVDAIVLGRRLGGQNFKRIAKIDEIEVNIPFPTSWTVIYPMVTGRRDEVHGTTYWATFTIGIKNNDVLEYCFLSPNLNQEQTLYEYVSQINNKQLAEKLNKDSQLNKPISINFE